MTKQFPVMKTLVQKGMKQEDIEGSFSQMSSYFQSIQSLEKCVDKANQKYLPGRGNLRADILVISNKPDEHEWNTKFIGFSSYSMFLTALLNRIGVKFHDVYWTTAVKGNYERVNMTIITDHYKKYLKEEINTVDPTVILAFGSTAISSLANEPIRIEKAIGESFFYEVHPSLADIPVIPFHHPRDMIKMEKQDFKETTSQLWQRIKEIGELL